MNSEDNRPMPWCKWCKGYHMKEARCIAREMWGLIHHDGTVQLFKRRKDAFAMGHTRSDYRKFRLIPVK